MSEIENELDVQPEQHEESHEEHEDVARHALYFSLLYLLMVVALWGYVYLTLLERGMTQ